MLKFDGVKGSDVLASEQRDPKLWAGEYAGHEEVIMLGRARSWYFTGTTHRGQGITQYNFSRHAQAGGSKREAVYFEFGNLREGGEGSGYFDHPGRPGEQ